MPEGASRRVVIGSIIARDMSVLLLPKRECQFLNSQYIEEEIIYGLEILWGR